jgi:hypothetical protein
VSCAPGRWIGTPKPTFSYRWRRIPRHGHAVWIHGATAARYTLIEADVGTQLACEVTGRNSVGRHTATSPPTRRIRTADVGSAAAHGHAPPHAHLPHAPTAGIGPKPNADVPVLAPRRHFG